LQNGIISSLPSLLLWLFSLPVSWLADWAISGGKISTKNVLNDSTEKVQKMSTEKVRKICSGIGLFGPAICTLALSFGGCDSIWIVFWIYLAIMLVGANHSGLNVSLGKPKLQVLH
jgi:hypothetical protein